MSQPSTPSEIEEEYVWNFFGPSAEYYLQTWRLRQQGKVITFNAPAFFLGIFWFMYRRMYLILALILVLLTLETTIEEDVFGYERGTGAILLVNLATASVFGFLGNSLYLWHAERKMRKLVALNLPREELLERLRRAGGTSWRPLLATLALVALWVGAYVWLSQHPELAGNE